MESKLESKCEPQKTSEYVKYFWNWMFELHKCMCAFSLIHLGPDGVFFFSEIITSNSIKECFIAVVPNLLATDRYWSVNRLVPGLEI